MVKIRVNDPCPCGSGKKYKKCCKDKDILWEKDEHGDFCRMIPVEGRLEEIIEKLDNDINKHFERERLSNDPFLPHTLMYSNKDTERQMVEVMEEVGLDPAYIYAYKKTGVLLTEEMVERTPGILVDEWNNAVNEFDDFGGDPEEWSEESLFDSKLSILIDDIDSLIYLFGIVVEKYFNGDFPDDSTPEGAEVMSPVAYMGLNIARSQRALRSIKHLIIEDYDEDALKLVRGLYENYLHIILVQYQPKSIVSLVDAKFGLRDGSFEYLEKNGKQDKRKVVRRSNSEVYPAYFSGYKMAETSKRSFDIRFYDSFYRIASDVVHPSVFNIKDYVRDDKLSPLDSDWKEDSVIYSIFIGCLISREVMTIKYLPDSVLVDCVTVTRRLLSHLLETLEFLKTWSERLEVSPPELEIVYERIEEILSELSESS